MSYQPLKTKRDEEVSSVVANTSRYQNLFCETDRALCSIVVTQCNAALVRCRQHCVFYFGISVWFEHTEHGMEVDQDSVAVAVWSLDSDAVRVLSGCTINR